MSNVVGGHSLGLTSANISAERTIGGPTYQEMIEEMDRELNNIIEDFNRPVYVEAFRIANETSKLSFSQLLIVDPQEFGVERAEQERVELRRLRPAEAGYHHEFRCMDGTRQSLLNHIADWVTNKSGQKNVQQINTYWLYGAPGIGKTSLAHSICASLHERNHLVGAFFCRRDDPHLSEPLNIIPTFIYKLAMLFPLFRTIVAKHLRDDPNLTPQSMKASLFLDFIRSFPHHPEHSLVFVIDALDECGDARSRPDLLRLLTSAAAQAPWLKIIITSRTEVDIQLFFDTFTQTSHLYDLATDQDASADLQTFARTQFDLVASVRYLDTPWPKESDFNRIISRANGLFIFIKTLALALEPCEDPEEVLKAALQDSAEIGLESLYELYSSILKTQIVPQSAEFWRMIRVLTTSPYHALSDHAIAERAEVKPNLVKEWVDALSSLLYRDEAGNRGIRVRHLSVYDFFVSDKSNNVRHSSHLATPIQESISTSANVSPRVCISFKCALLVDIFANLPLVRDSTTHPNPVLL